MAVRMERFVCVCVGGGGGERGKGRWAAERGCKRGVGGGGTVGSRAAMQAGGEQRIQFSQCLVCCRSPLWMAFRAKQNKLCPRCCVLPALRQPEERAMVWLANGDLSLSLSLSLHPCGREKSDWSLVVATCRPIIHVGHPCTCCTFTRERERERERNGVAEWYNTCVTAISFAQRLDI